MPQKLFQELDALVRQGALDAAKERLQKSRLRNFSPEDVGKACQIARRCGLPDFALRLLGPIVRPQGRVKAEATPEHLTEYAGALIHMGGVLEGMRLLENLKAPFPPLADLYWAYGCFSRWEYAQAIPHLEAYVERVELTDYERAVGKANLAAALVYERAHRAHDFLLETIEEFRSKSYERLRLNLLMSLADLDIAERRLGEARKALETAGPLLAGSSSFESLFLQKWLAILSLHEGHKTAVGELKEVEHKAQQMRHWETLRNLDYHRAVYARDETLLAKLYFGTPYPFLRERILQDVAGGWTPPALYEWIPEGVKKNPKCFDLTDTVAMEKQFSKMKAGQLGTRLIGALAADFYRPAGVGTLFGTLFPDEFYNYVSSPTRIHQLVKRTRLAVKALGLVLSESQGLYSLSSSPVRIRVPLHLELIPRADTHLERLREHFGQNAFSAQEAADALNLNYWSVVKWLKEAVAGGSLDRLGAARATRYRFVSPASHHYDLARHPERRIK